MLPPWLLVKAGDKTRSGTWRTSRVVLIFNGSCALNTVNEHELLKNMHTSFLLCDDSLLIMSWSFTFWKHWEHVSI